MAPMAKTAMNPIPAPKPAALLAVAKGPPLLGAVEDTGFDVGGGAVGVKVIVVSLLSTVIAEVTGVADHEEELEDELSEVLEGEKLEDKLSEVLEVVGGAGVLVVLDGVGVGMTDVDSVLEVGAMFVVLDVVGSEKGGDDLKGNEDPPGTKPGLDVPSNTNGDGEGV